MRMYPHYTIEPSAICVGMVLEGALVGSDEIDLKTVNVVTHVDRDAYSNVVVTVAEVELKTERITPPRFQFYEGGVAECEPAILVGFGDPVSGVNNFHLLDPSK